MSQTESLLVVGAGIAGVTAALEAAEAGAEVILVEKEAYIGGRVLRNHQYFPKMCPPSCGMEINIRRLERNPRVRVLVQTEVVEAQHGDAGWQVKLATQPAYVNDRCTSCGDCSEACTSTVSDAFNRDLKQVPAIRLPHLNAWPKKFVFDRTAVSESEANAIKEACSCGAVDLDASATTETVQVGAVVVAMGWQPFPIEELPEFGGGAYSNVIANVDLERLAAPEGPTGGKILRPSDNTAPKKIAFVQCAGSRDVNHLPYCSGVCCLASLKQALYVHEQLPDTEISIYFIDRRAPGRNEDVLLKTAAIEGIRLVKGKVGTIKEVDDNLLLRVENVEQNTLSDESADLVVLATGMVPNAANLDLPILTRMDDDGFILDDPESAVMAAGVARRPEDVAASVRDATGAVARAWAAAQRRA